MISHLNPASVVNDESWIKAGRASWSWWSNGGTPRDYKAQLKYVDLSAEMGWEYMLIDAGWQNMGNGGTMEDVVKYAQQKGWVSGYGTIPVQDVKRILYRHIV